MSLDETLTAAIREDWRKAPLSARERAMLEYVEKLTKTPARCTREDHEPLRAAGLDDRGILQVTMIASMFAYLNRVADGVGVGKE